MFWESSKGDVAALRERIEALEYRLALFEEREFRSNPKFRNAPLPPHISYPFMDYERRHSVEACRMLGKNFRTKR